MRGFWRAAIVFFLALGSLGYRMGEAGIATALVDPVGRIAAQDEAVYSYSAVRMAREGGWLTPMFLGRYIFTKPPLLLWLSGASAKVLGVSPFSLRLPCLLAAALATALVFHWVARERGVLAGCAAALLVVSNHLWHTLARVNLTDMLLACCLVTAFWMLARDPSLRSWLSFWGFAGATAAAVMTKSVAGLVPVLALAVLCALWKSAEKPPWRRVAEVTLAAGVLALPWHLYQLMAHTRWFWAEYVLSEHLTLGVVSPYQAALESAAPFYLKRAALIDPVLCVAALVAAPALRKRGLLASWMFVTVATMLVFQYRNAAYLLPLVPAVAILFPLRRGKTVNLLLCAALCVKLAYPQQPWGISYRPDSVLESVALLEAYAAEKRPHELVLVSPDDQFVSALLPLKKVRYCYIEPVLERYGRPPLDFRYLGVLVTGREFLDLERRRPVFEQRLREFGLNSGEPVATVILARSNEEVVEIIRSHPDVDFFVPAEYRPAAGESHLVREAGHRLFLLARN